MSDPLAGWYEDPTDVTRERWWDGQRWTSQTRPGQPTPAATSGHDPWSQPTVLGYGAEQGQTPPPSIPGSGPGPATGPSGFGPAGGQPWPLQPIDPHWETGPGTAPGPSPAVPPEPAPGPPGGAPKWPWIAGGVIAVVTVLGLIALGLTYLNGTAAPPDTTRTAPTTARRTLTTVPPTSGVPAPTTTNADSDPTEPTTRLAYKRLGPPWVDNAGSRSPFGNVTAGERVVTQAQTPSGGAYVAEVQLYPFVPPPPNPGDLAGLTQRLIDEYIAAGTGVYPDPHTYTAGEARDITVSGRKGYVRKGRVAFDVAGYDAKGESFATVAVDTPNGLACVFISVPENRQDLLPVIDRVITSLYLAP